MSKTLKSFRILAQSFTTSQRIAKTIQATDQNAVMWIVSGELEDAGYYILSIEAA